MSGVKVEWSVVRRIWIPLLFLIELVGAALLPVRDVVRAAIGFWSGLHSSLAAVPAWQQGKVEVLLGTGLLVLFAATLFASIVFLLWQRPHRFRTSWAIFNAKSEIQGHMTRVIAHSKPKSGTHKNMRLWDQLAAAAIVGHADRGVLSQHNHDGNDLRPVLFCNFQAYAKAVAAVRDLLERLPKKSPCPRIYTLFKRSIIDWYNPFPFEGSQVGNQDRAQVTHEWWEKYKEGIVRLAHPAPGQKSQIAMKRLVVDPGPPALVQDYMILTDKAQTLASARVLKTELERTYGRIEWHPTIRELLASTCQVPDDLLIHLIGKPATPDGLKRIPYHFRESYHSAGDPPTIPVDTGGVYLRYLRQEEGFMDLLAFDDLFLVEIPDGLLFGLAFIDDEIRDTNGMWIISPTLLEKDSGFIKLFNNAWDRGGQPEWCVCIKSTTQTPPVGLQ